MKLNLEKRYSFPKLNSFGTDTETNIIKLFKGNKNNELEDIFDLINKESKIYNEPPFNSVKQLKIYIRRNRNSIENIINKVIKLLQNISNVNMMLSIVKTLFDLVTEGRNHHLSNLIDVLIRKLDNMPQTASVSIEKIVNTISDLIKLDNISIQKFLENVINSILNKLTKSNEQKNAKTENAKFYCILLLSKIIESCSLFAYNILTNVENFPKILKIIPFMKDPKVVVRYAVGELIKQFNHILKDRDYGSKKKYQKKIFDKLFLEYKNHIDENNGEVTNANLISGILSVLRNLYDSEPLILIKEETRYQEFYEELSKCINNKSNQIKIEFIRIIPDFYKMNKEIFTKKYLSKTLGTLNKFLNIKTNNEIRNKTLVTLGYLSLYISNDYFNICLNNLISLLKILENEKKVFDDEVFKCLADLLNNKDKIYMEVILTKLDVNLILSKMFKNGLTTYKIEFLSSIMVSFSNFSKQYISTAISSLQAVSLIICDEDFKFEFFYKEIESIGVKKNFIDPNLDSILNNVQKYIRKYINSISYYDQSNNNQDNKLDDDSSKIPDHIKCKCLHDLKTITYALTLFSRIEYNYFLKDMLIFYVEKILPLLVIAKNKIKKKILELLSAKFVKIFQEDTNFSEFLLNNIIDSITYLIYNVKDVSTQVYALRMLKNNDIFLDIILKNKEIHCSKFLGYISTNIDNEIHKVIIQMVGNLMERSNDKKYFNFMVKKNIYNFLFEIDNCEDIIFKEDLIELIYYKSVYLKKAFDIDLIEKILEALIYLIINYNYEGNIFIMSLKIAYELISSESINYNFLIDINLSKTLTKYCYILLIIVVDNLKEGGNNNIKTKLSLKVLYQIIKLLKIDIYSEINPNIIIESLDSLDGYNKNISFKNRIPTKNINLRTKVNFYTSENLNILNNDQSYNYNYGKELFSSTRKNEKIILVDILIQSIIKSQNNDEHLKILLNIFGLSGAMDPLVMEKLLIGKEISIYHSEDSIYNKNYFEENTFKVHKYNHKLRISEEIDLSNIDPIKYKTILYILRVLKENTQQELMKQIINNLKTIISNLEKDDIILVEVIFSEIIEILPNLNNIQKNDLFTLIISIMQKFKEVAKVNLNDLVNLTKNYIGLESFFEKCYDIFTFLFENFIKEMEIYYKELIPIFLSLINFRYNAKNEKEKNYESHIIELFLVMVKNENIYSYLNIIFNKIIPLFLKTNDFNDKLLLFFHKIIKYIVFSSVFYPLLIDALIGKIKLYMEEKNSLIKGKNSEVAFKKENKQFFEKIMNIFKDMYLINKDNFINYLPKIIKILNKFSILKYIDLETFIYPLLTEYPNYNILNISNIHSKNITQQCFPFCKLGFENLKAKKNTKNTKRNSETNSIKLNLANSKNNTTKIVKNIKKIKSISRKNSIDGDLIMKIFDISNCLTKKDWYEWFKSTTKILFEQSPSVFINCSKILSDYYYPLIYELYNYSFLDVYNNINETKKTFLSTNLNKALENPKTPSEILLAIINLEEFSERQKVDMCYFDNILLGKVSNKCKAYAKALYFFETNYLNKEDFDDIKELLEVYYELNLPESAIGLLFKSSGKNKNKNKRGVYIQERKNLDSRLTQYNPPENNEDIDKEKEYIFYIKMHDYQRALDIITKLLEKEENFEKIQIFKNDKNLCLNGLYDWEELLSNNEEINELDEEIYGAKGIYDISINRNNKNNITKNTVNIELNEDNEDLVIKNKIEKQILLSKACMNLGEWKQLENHLYNLTSSFSDIEEYKDLYLNNSGERNNNISGNNEINYIRYSTGGDENAFCINHTLNFGPNMNSSDEDSIHFNKYIESYNQKKREKEFNQNIQNSNMNIEKNVRLLQYDKFINYKELINENQKLSFLENNEDILFDLNFHTSILSIENSKYDLAMEYIDEARNTILSRIKPLLNESYVRGYELLAKNQLLYNLEQIINYKKNHMGDEVYFKQIVNLWDKNLNIIRKDINIYEKFLAIRSLVLPIEKEYTRYMDLVKICRALNLHNKGEKVLLRLKHKLKENNNKEIKTSLVNEIYTKVELSYNKCLFERGKFYEAIDKSRYLVELLDNSVSKINKTSENSVFNDLSEIDDKIKGKIYGYYAIFKSKIIDFENPSQKEKWEKIDNYFNTESNLKYRSNQDVNTITNEKEKNDISKENINYYFNLALKYNSISYKLWQNFAMFNYKYYKYIIVNNNRTKEEKKIEKKDKEIIFAKNAVNGFRNSLFIGGKDKKKTFQDILRLLDIFFSEGNKDDKLLNLIDETFNYIDIDAFLNVIPQLLSRFDIEDNKILDVLFNILVKIGLKNPHAILPSLIVMKNSNSKKRKSSSTKVLDSIIKKDNNMKKLIDEYEIFINELIKCAMLLHEEWSEAIEDIMTDFQNGDYNSFTNQMMKLHEKLKKNPTSLYEINFYQKFISELKEAENNLLLFKQYKNPEYAKTSWELYHQFYKKIIDSYQSFQIINLKYVSPQLSNFKNSNIVIPINYSLNYKSLFFNESNFGKSNQIKENLDLASINSIIYIKRIGKTLSLFNTKQHPRKMTMIGSDNKEYMFLLKGHEDLRQDERVMQLLDLVNIILAKEKSTSNKKLFIDTYTVFPISHNAGLIGWVKNCDTLHQLIKEQRMETNTIPSIEHKKIFKTYPKFESGLCLTKVETFKEALNETEGTELKTVIWEKSKNCETWLNRRTNYSRSLAVMSIVGYILGLGDRHPSNLMMSRKNGKIIHIDFGDCFEVTMKREKFPEKVPFRLTRMLIKALEVAGIEGTFRLICIQIMELLRKKKDSLLAILGSFIYDPLISFRLMIPMIIKRRKILDQIQMTGNKKKNKKDIKNESPQKAKRNSKIILHKINNKENLFDFQFNNSKNFESHSMKNNYEVSFIKMNQFLKNSEDSRKKIITKELEKEEKKGEEIKMDNILKNEEEEEKEKDEKKKMEEDERLIFNLFEEKDEIESEELNKIAQMVLDRIKDKLAGTDIYPDLIYDAKTQVDKLITQATSYENLAQSYLGWCPFW